MFKYFIGKIYLLEPSPKEGESQLDIPFPDEILDDIDEETYKDSLTSEQIKKIVLFKQEMYDLLGKESYDRLLKENILQGNDAEFIKNIAYDMKQNPNEWNGLAFLNSGNVDTWDRMLNKLIYLRPGEWGEGAWSYQHSKFVVFVKMLAQNWEKTIPELLNDLEDFDINIDDFFKLERITTFKLAALVNDINILQKEIINNGVDVSPFIAKASHAFLPSVVYQLEEYGLPRMISRKIHENHLINFVDDALTIHAVIEKFHRIGRDNLLSLNFLDEFDKYILRNFYDGITPYIQN